MKIGEYVFRVISPARGDCHNCKERRWCIVVWFRRPFNQRIFICHKCIMEQALRIKDICERGKKATERILKYRAKQKKEKTEKEAKKDERILPKVLADTKGGESETAQENGRSGNPNSGSRPIDAAQPSTSKGGPKGP